jgi:di/tricarboxylate transporter
MRRVNLNSACRSIDGKTLVLIVGMLPFSRATQRTGGVDRMADGMMALLGGAGTRAVLASLFAITVLRGHFIIPVP